MIGSYTKIYNLGDRRLAQLYDDPLVVEEKVDGSQFSFMLDLDGRLHFRSKRVEVYADNPGMFELGVKAVQKRKDRLEPGYIYRGEFLRAPKHNALAYERVPEGHIMLWDIHPPEGTQHHTNYTTRREMAEAAGFESIPVLMVGWVRSSETVEGLMKTTSVLGGSLVEGIVLKNYNKMNEDGKLLAGKYVSERFREVNKENWKKDNPGSRDIIQVLGAKYKTTARWDKAVQHLAESGKLTHTPRDIGRLMKEVQMDIYEECAEDIKADLFKWAWKKMARMTTGGLPEWYKQKIMEEGFGD